MTKSSPAHVVSTARQAFTDGRTRPEAWRRATLDRLRALIVSMEEELIAALASDLGKPRLEAWATEVGFVISDIEHTLAHLPSWMRPERVPTPVLFQPGWSQVVPEPLGVICVIAPWNYPVQLLLLPMVAAIAAGNAVVGKPSELAPASSTVLSRLVGQLNDPAIRIVEGGVAETTDLLTKRFDHILYTGNGRVARIVMRAAAENLTPVTLELGGKSPAIVSRHAKIEVSARRIVWGKFMNAGQTCIAPDYVLVERPVHDQLVAAIGEQITAFYGTDPKLSADYGRIITDPHFQRISKYLHNGAVAFGGESDADIRYIAPTVLTGVSQTDPVMQEEIFGPVLPIIAVESLDEAIAFVNANDKPLALYSFSEESSENDWVLGQTSSGGACVNGTLLHMSNSYLPFGGVGESGMGSYHGRFGFDTFSHHKSIHTRTTKLDPPLLYPPYTPGKEKLIRRGFGLPDPRDFLGRIRQRVRR